jgi:acetyl-CoA decarbonylase/synthase complex subunit gamma
MALTGIEIYKLLPKTNCKKCGFPTCLAFAMQLAQKKVELAKCPDVSDEAKQTLEGASAPPVKLVTVGSGDDALKVGEEVVLFRHEDKFMNPCGVAIKVPDNLDEAALGERLEKISKLHWTRVGMEIFVDAVAVENASGNADAFKAAAQKAAAGTVKNVILMSENPDNLIVAAEAIKDSKPLLYAANKDSFQKLGEFCGANKLPLTVSGATIEEIADLTPKLKELGVEEIMVIPPGKNVKENLHELTKLRRMAIKKAFRPLGYPAVVDASAGVEDELEQIAEAGVYVAKYAGIVILEASEPWQVLPLLTMRQNIYTNPQKPIQVDPKLYEIGEPDENSPVMFTTNFSLTYFSVEGEVEASRVPAYILAVDTEGLSVLTAYSGDKLNEKVVAKAITESDIEGKVKHKKLIIPGLVAVMSGKLEEETGWTILVGPKEASYIPKYLQEIWK